MQRFDANIAIITYDRNHTEEEMKRLFKIFFSSFPYKTTIEVNEVDLKIPRT